MFDLFMKHKEEFFHLFYEILYRRFSVGVFFFLTLQSFFQKGRFAFQCLIPGVPPIIMFFNHNSRIITSDDIFNLSMKKREFNKQPELKSESRFNRSFSAMIFSAVVFPHPFSP